MFPFFPVAIFGNFPLFPFFLFIVLDLGSREGRENRKMEDKERTVSGINRGEILEHKKVIFSNK
jgi:hypothetical protein